MTNEVNVRDALSEIDPSHEGDVDVEMALLAVLASRDVGEATEPVRLDMLSATEKSVLLNMMRDRLGLADSSPAGAPRADSPSGGGDT